MNESNLRSRRHLLGNPYAHIEQLESPNVQESLLTEPVRLDRYNLQDPYAHLDGDGRFSAAQPSRMEPRSFIEVEHIATDLQRRLWSSRLELWDGAAPNAIGVLDVVRAAKLLGFRLEVVDSLGIFVDRADKVAVAGVIDRPAGSILISRDFSPAAQNFTAAHELGHALLHPHIDVVHRDRSIDGLLLRRDRVELEADKFAVYFLMPAKLLRTEFVDRFLTSSFDLSEASAFALQAKPLGLVLEKIDGRDGRRRGLARLLASATQYNGKHFYSLAAHFNVTVETMAIRLEELELVPKNLF